MLTGSLPLGESLPVMISARAFPPSCPGYHAIKIACTLCPQLRKSIPPPAFTTTATLSWSEATLLMRYSCPYDNANGRSNPSPSVLLLNPAHTITFLACFSEEAKRSSSIIPAWKLTVASPTLSKYSIRNRYISPALTCINALRVLNEWFPQSPVISLSFTNRRYPSSPASWNLTVPSLSAL